MRATWQAHQVIPVPGAGDPDPNTTPPSATRVFLSLPDEQALLLQLLDGTSATAAVWCFDVRAALWVQVATVPVLATGPAVAAVEANAQTFVQLTALVGPPTQALVLPSSDAAAVLAQLIANAPGLFNWDDAVLAYTGADLTSVVFSLNGSVVKTCTLTYVTADVTHIVWT